MKFSLPPARLSRSLLAIGVVVICGAFVVADAPYLHDFGEWLYQSQILKNLLVQPEVVPGFSIIPYPVPNSLPTALMAILGIFMPGLWAGKAFLILLLIAWLPVIRLFVQKHVDETLQASTTLILYALLALPTFFWYGFVSYQLGMLLFTWFLAIDNDRARPLNLLLFSVFIFFAHAMVFLVFVAYVCLRILLQKKLTLALALAPSAMLSIWFLAGRHFAEIAPPVADARWAGLGEAMLYKIGYPAMLGPFKNFLQADGRSLFETQAWIYWLGFLTNFIVVLLLGVFVSVVLWDRMRIDLPNRHETNGTHGAMTVAMFGLAIIYLVAPYNFFGVFNPGGRLLLPLILMAFIMGREHARWLNKVIFWPITLFTLLTCAGYFYLVAQARGTDISSLEPAIGEALPADSVFAFNEALYVSTRYNYFNYRVFAFAGQLERVAREEYDNLPFSHGLIARRQEAD